MSSMKRSANSERDRKFTYVACVFGGFHLQEKSYEASIRTALRLICIVAFLVVAQGHLFARGGWIHFIATAYSVSGETKSQSITEEGRTVAADPSVLPIGTVIEVRNAGPYSGQYVVQDTGEKIVGRKIDIYIARTKEALQFGKRNVRVRIIKSAPETPSEQRRAAAQASIEPKPAKADRVSSYYRYPTEGETASVQ
jgi:3D (Asp-Asp-Asp) domain-containing protein